MRKLIVFTDLDGTLLDTQTYRWDAALPALAALREREAQIVLCSSKTEAELRQIQQEIGVSGPVIGENGASGASIEEVRRVLRQASEESRTATRGFGDMSLEDVMEATGLDAEAARRAMDRQWDEPFMVEGDAAALCAAIEAQGYQWTQGGRFFHIYKQGSKGEAVKHLLAENAVACSIGLGDSENDRSFLEVVEYPIWIRDGRGPVAWNEAILALLPLV